MNGAERRRWLERLLTQGDNALRYYLGPTGIPDKLNALARLAEFSDAGDYVEAGEASRDLWNDPSLANAARYATAGTALAIPMVGARMMNEGVDVVGDAIRSGRDDLSAFGGDEAGAIRAWHGSPHDFDKFDSSQIGTGEGAQAYGHGLYFAENPETAVSYRKTLARGGHHLIADGKDLGQLPTHYGADIPDAHWKLMQDTIKKTGLAERSDDWIADSITRQTMNQKALGRTIEDAQRAAIEHVVPGGYENRNLTEHLRNQIHEDVKQTWEALPELSYRDPGRLYEVEIDADPEDFLDWDAPLSEQPETVKAKIEKTLYYLPNHKRDAAERALKGTETPYDRDWNITRGANLIKQAPAGIDKELRKAGIPGIRYLDQLSRPAAEGTRNYVVFDADLVRILKKYGLAGALVGGAGYDAATGEAMAAPPPRFD